MDDRLGSAKPLAVNPPALAFASMKLCPKPPLPSPSPSLFDLRVHPVKRGRRMAERL